MYKRRKRNGPIPRQERYAATFARTDDYLDQHIDALVSRMKEVALGEVWEGRQTQEGFAVFRHAPDRQALAYLIDRHLYKSSTQEDAMLGEARTEAAKEQVRLIMAQTRTQLSQRAYTDVQTEAFKLATITPELFERCLIAGLQVPIAILQSISDEERARFLESRAAWQEFVRRVAQKIHIASSEAMAQVYDAAIPATFEPPREEEAAASAHAPGSEGAAEEAAS
jgi:hypothetical protein